MYNTESKMSNFLFSKFTNYKYIHLDISLEPDIASYKDSIVAILPIQTSIIIIQITEYNYVILE